MKHPKTCWQDMTSDDFADGGCPSWIAVLPVAAIEQHGPHLPLSTDAVIGEGLLAAALDKMPPDIPLSVLPPQWVGKSNEHIASPGTLTHHWQTVLNAWVELGECVHRAGVRKLIFLNSHGGNAALIDIVAQELRVRFDMLAVSASWMRFGVPDGLFSPDELSYGIHGGDIETSLMLHLRPDLVQMEKARDFRSIQSELTAGCKQLRAHGGVSFAWKAQDLNRAGVVGNAAIASAQKGKALLDFQAARFIDLCQDVHGFDMARLWKKNKQEKTEQ